MRKKYADCQRADGDCTVCSLAKAGRDCRDNLITKLEQSRRMAKLTQSQLAEKAGINIRQHQHRKYHREEHFCPCRRAGRERPQPDMIRT